MTRQPEPVNDPAAGANGFARPTQPAPATAPVEMDPVTARLVAAYVQATSTLACQAAGHLIEAVGVDTPEGIDAVGALFHATLSLDECRRALRPYHRLRPVWTVLAAGFAALTAAHVADGWLGAVAWFGGPFAAAGLVLAFGAVRRCRPLPTDLGLDREYPGPPDTGRSGPAGRPGGGDPARRRALHRAHVEMRGALHALRLARELLPGPPHPEPVTARQRRHTRAAVFVNIAEPILRRAETHVSQLVR